MIGRLNALLMALLVSFTLIGYRNLPARIPVHFTLAGEPDRWGPRSTAIIIPIVGIATIAFLYVIMRLAVRNPKLVNLPDKKRFLELPENEQRWVLEALPQSTDWLITMLCLLFIVIELSMFRAAAGRDTSALLQGTLITMMVGMVVMPIAMLLHLQRRLNEAIRRHRMGGEIR